jgi:hypothetical protein
VKTAAKTAADWDDIMRALNAGKPCDRCAQHPLYGPESHAKPLSEPTLGDSTPQAVKPKRTRRAKP